LSNLKILINLKLKKEKEKGKSREKVVSKEEMLSIAHKKV